MARIVTAKMKAAGALVEIKDEESGEFLELTFADVERIYLAMDAAGNRPEIDEETEAVAACLEDDAATLRDHEEGWEEIARNMEDAAIIVRRLATRQDIEQ